LKKMIGEAIAPKAIATSERSAPTLAKAPKTKSVMTVPDRSPRNHAAKNWDVLG